MTENKNIFCNLSDLRNESDVEQFFIIRLLTALGYKDKNIHTKKTISIRIISKGKNKKEYRPDYTVYQDNSPIIVVDVKHPNNTSDEGLKDALMYAREINGDYTESNPIKYCIGSNGLITKVCNWDENNPFLTIHFNDFQFGNKKYNQLVTILSYKEINKKEKESKAEFEFRKPDLKEINGIFKSCHNLIWKKEKIGPKDAFYEFSKIMFVKLNEDKNIKKKRDDGDKIKKEDFYFSSYWIDAHEKLIANPFDSILFKKLKDELEEKISAKEKKRIFEKDEQINLKPSTIKQVVNLLEHYDLMSIDEDLNGRLFERFLNATIRGKELGQFFTPRTVVKFMTRMADLQLDFKNKKVDTVLDGCCGTGGFLIEVMAVFTEKINQNVSLTNKEKEKILEAVKKQCIYGIDASKMISRIARINMYLHGDGGSRIYNLDFLDKKIGIETGINKELRDECTEYKEKILNEKIKFDVILTNPPFSMRYEKDKPDEKEILEDYELAFHPDTKNMFSSLQSNIMFIERYYELLKPKGKLITVIDESLLNTSSNNELRDFIKNKFIIKAVISLPENTFVKADTGVKASILYLIKKESDEEKQSSTFMALAENVGHNDVGKPEPKSNELFFSDGEYQYDFSKGILGDFKKFENGLFKNKKFSIKNNLLPNEEDWKTFIADDLNDNRLDVKIHSPYLKYLIEFLKRDKWDYLNNLVNFEEITNPPITDFYRLIDLRNIEEKTAKILKIKEVDELGSEKIVFKKGQLLICTLSPEKGKSIFIDEELDGCVGSTEFIPVTVKKSKIILEYFLVMIRSKIVLDQWKYQVTGSTPSRYRIGDVEVKNTIIPLPDRRVQRRYSTIIIKAIKENKQINDIFENSLQKTEEKYIRNILKLR
jgi:type I restriction enzyme M protein